MHHPVRVHAQPCSVVGIDQPLASRPRHAVGVDGLDAAAIDPLGDQRRNGGTRLWPVTITLPPGVARRTIPPGEIS
jgi:hypothetical protein